MDNVDATEITEAKHTGIIFTSTAAGLLKRIHVPWSGVFFYFQFFSLANIDLSTKFSIHVVFLVGETSGTTRVVPTRKKYLLYIFY